MHQRLTPQKTASLSLFHGRQTTVQRSSAVHHGDLATIGRRSAVVALDEMRLTGLIDWWIWRIAHVRYLSGSRSHVIVSF
jgi:NADH dehydrogenase FAD-containing subunit